jgi:excisionase family DNA binding protein
MEKVPPETEDAPAEADEPWTYSVEEARQMLRIGKNQIYPAIHSGEIEAIRLNARFRVLGAPLRKRLRGSA